MVYMYTVCKEGGMLIGTNGSSRDGIYVHKYPSVTIEHIHGGLYLESMENCLG